jgi:hypothetical protein
MDFDANPAGRQDFIVLQGFGPAPAVRFTVEGSDTRVTIAADSSLLVGVTGIGAKTASMHDVLILTGRPPLPGRYALRHAAQGDDPARAKRRPTGSRRSFRLPAPDASDKKAPLRIEIAR